MTSIRCLLAAGAIGGLAAMTAGAASATPLASGLAIGTAPQFDESFVQKVHGWHCYKKYGWYRGHKWRHRHLRACEDYYDDYDDYDDYRYYPYSYGYSPFVLGFSFGNFGHHRRHHHKHW
jgi:hypothetical protein